MLAALMGQSFLWSATPVLHMRMRGVGICVPFSPVRIVDSPRAQTADGQRTCGTSRGSDSYSLLPSSDVFFCAFLYLIQGGITCNVQLIFAKILKLPEKVIWYFVRYNGVCDSQHIEYEYLILHRNIYFLFSDLKNNIVLHSINTAFNKYNYTKKCSEKCKFASYLSNWIKKIRTKLDIYLK